MHAPSRLEKFEVGYDIPALPGMRERETHTPSLVVDLEPLERNIARLRTFCAEKGVRHRLHAKTHKSVDIARYQMEVGDSCGILLPESE